MRNVAEKRTAGNLINPMLYIDIQMANNIWFYLMLFQLLLLSGGCEKFAKSSY